jgi:toxin ParE1/3/4
MSEPFFSPSSRRDLLEILDHIAKDKPVAAIRFVERLEEECWSLARNPQSGTTRDDLIPGLRCSSVGNYVVYFRPVRDGIEVVRVVHGARDVGKLFE